MKTSDIIVSILFTVALFGPIVYLYYYSKTHYFKILSSLKNFARSKNLNLSQFDVWGNKALALDDKNEILMFSDQYLDKNPVLEIDLKKATQVELITSSKEIIVELRTYSNSQPVSIVIFDPYVNDPLDRGFHLELAKKWVNKIKPFVKKKPKMSPPKAA